MKSIFFRKIRLIILGLILFSFVSYAGNLSIIPYPQSVSEGKGEFIFSRNTTLSLPDITNNRIKKMMQQFVNQFEIVSGFKIQLKDKLSKSVIEIQQDKTIPFEGYRLSINSHHIYISASSPNGFFYALQTLYQLLPADIYATHKVGIKNWSVPCSVIEDFPRFRYRGLHLDVCRHFFPVEFIKKYIDAMAIHKLNRFHWHLTDDQGWRLQIKKYPLLTQIGSNRTETLMGHYYDYLPQRYDGKAYGGFYTQDEAREIVKYAAERFITVIPEIEMPGHATAALAAYPEFSCNRQNINVATKWGIFDDVFCTRDTTFHFLEDILSEVMDIFPSEYIHIGGDECPKTRWTNCPDCQYRIKQLGLKDEHELQSYFIHRIEKYVNTRGRQIIGWDEIQEGGLAPNATVMSWRGTSGGITAAQNHHNVVMTPGESCYFDKYQDEPENEPLAIGGLLRIQDVYKYEPVPAILDENEAKYIEGAQANIWTEYITSPEQVEYMAFPRLAALAEVVWTNSKQKNYNRFCQNMLKQFERYSVLELNYSCAFKNLFAEVKSTENHRLEINLQSNLKNANIHYTTDGSKPTNRSKIFAAPIVINQNTQIRAISLFNKQLVGNEFNKNFSVSKVTGLTYQRTNMSDWINGGSATSLTDGILGDTRTTLRWQAIVGNTDKELILDLKKIQKSTSVSVGILYLPAMRGLFPPEVSVYLSDDGNVYQCVASQKITKPNNGIKTIYRPEFVFPSTSARFVKIVFKFAGTTTGVYTTEANSQLFVDEVEVN